MKIRAYLHFSVLMWISLLSALWVGETVAHAEESGDRHVDRTAHWRRSGATVLTGFKNMYHATVLPVEDAAYPYRMWFMGWAADDTNSRLPGCDAIFLARGRDLDSWEVYCGDDRWGGSEAVEDWTPVLVADDKPYDAWHNGDPSIVQHNGRYYMAYSATGSNTDGIRFGLPGDEDGDLYCVMGAVSDDGITWQRSERPLLVYEPEVGGRSDRKTDAFVHGMYHRPSLLFDQGRWRLWFDYWTGSDVAMGYAEADEDAFSPSPQRQQATSPSPTQYAALAGRGPRERSPNPAQYAAAAGRGLCEYCPATQPVPAAHRNIRTSLPAPDPQQGQFAHGRRSLTGELRLPSPACPNGATYHSPGQSAATPWVCSTPRTGSPERAAYTYSATPDRRRQRFAQPSPPPSSLRGASLRATRQSNARSASGSERLLRSARNDEKTTSSSCTFRVLRAGDNPLLHEWPNPAVVKVGDQYYAFADPSGYGTGWPGRQLAEAQSADGITWNILGWIPPDPDTPACHVPAPVVLQADSTNSLVLFYACQIGGDPYDYRYDRIRYMKRPINE